MDLALNNLQRLICHKNEQTNQPNGPVGISPVKQTKKINWKEGKKRQKQ